MIRAALPLLVSLLVGCDDSRPVRTDWLLRFDPPGLRERAVRVDGVIVAGGCDSGGDVVYRYREAGGPPPSLLEPGRYGFGGSAIDGECRVYASGCEDYTLPLERGEDLVVTLTELDPPRTACTPFEVCDIALGECRPPLDLDAGSPDAGGRDAGPIDAGPPDAGPADPTLCDEIDSIFCADFEGSNVLEGWSFEIDDSTGAVERADAPVYRGTGAMHAYVTVAGASARAGVNIDPVTSGLLFVRLYAYVPASVALQETAVFTLNDDAPPYYQVGFILSADHPLVFISEPSRSARGSEPFPRDRWVCVQMQVTVADAGGTVELSLDGTPYVYIPSADTLPGAGIKQLVAGVQGYGMQTEPTEIYLDEVALGTSPIPCE